MFNTTTQPILPFLSALVGMLCWLSVLASPLSALANEPASIDPNQLVLQAVEQAVWGPSLQCRIRQNTVWKNQQVVTEGMYWQTGGGAGLLKMQLSLQSEISRNDFIQVSDGRLVWTNLGNGEPPRRVYLDRIREALGGWVRKPGVHPEASLYLAIGGHAESLRCLYHRYRWWKVFDGLDDQQRPVWQLFGTIRSEPPNPRSETRVDNILYFNAPPPEVPTDVRLTLGRDPQPLFLYKVDYYRREKSLEGLPGKLVRVSTVEYDEIVSPIDVAPNFFEYRVSDEADQIQDETNEYMPLNPQAILNAPLRR